MTPNIQSLVITYLITAIFYGGIGIILMWRLKRWTDKYDSDNAKLKGIQGFFMKWGKMFIFLIFGLPMINLLFLFIYVIKRETGNTQVVTLNYWHIIDLIMYNWKLTFWVIVWGLVNILRAIQGILQLTGEDFNIIAVKQYKNDIAQSWFFAWNFAFIFATLLWTWIERDDKWPFFQKWLAYIGSVIIPAVLLGQYFFTQTMRALPTSDTVAYIWHDVAKKNAALNTAQGMNDGPAPVEYGPSGPSPTTEQMGGWPWYYYLGGLLLLVLILFLLSRVFKSKKATTASKTETGETANAANGTASTSPGEAAAAASSSTAKQYDQSDYANDFLQIRRDIALFQEYEKMPYFCFEFKPYQDKVNRMRQYLQQQQNIRNDVFWQSDAVELVEELQRLITNNTIGKLSIGAVQTEANDVTFEYWNEVMRGIRTAAGKGFYLLSGDYATVLNALTQYANNQAVIVKAKFDATGGKTDKKDPSVRAYLVEKQTYDTILDWWQTVQELHKKVYPNVKAGQVNGIPEPPGFVAQLAHDYPKPFYGTIAGIILLILVWFFFLRGGSESPDVQPTPDQQETITTKTKLNAKEFEKQKQILNENLDLIAQSICEGQEVPRNAKENALSAATKLGVTGKQMNAEIGKRTNKCLEQKK